MKVGDLVREIRGQITELGSDEGEKVGVLVEWDVEEEQLPAAGWVKWHGDFDWSIVYADDIEVISESR